MADDIVQKWFAVIVVIEKRKESGAERDATPANLLDLWMLVELYGMLQV